MLIIEDSNLLFDEHFESHLLRVDLNPSKTKSARSWVRSMRIDIRTLHFDLISITCWIRFLHLLRLCNFCKVARHAKVPAEVLVLRVHRLCFLTSNCLEIWLMSSGTNQSRQYHESTMV